MIGALKKIFTASELKAKILFTLLMLLVCRIGAFVPVPGINQEAALAVFKSATGGGQNLFQLMDIFSGGAFKGVFSSGRRYRIDDTVSLSCREPCSSNDRAQSIHLGA